MTSVPKKPPLAVVLSLFLTGIFLSVESVRLMLNCRWKSEETGFFIALCTIEITEGFIFVSANKRKMMDFLYLSGALLLEEHTGGNIQHHQDPGCDPFAPSAEITLADHARQRGQRETEHSPEIDSHGPEQHAGSRGFREIRRQRVAAVGRHYQQKSDKGRYDPVLTTSGFSAFSQSHCQNSTENQHQAEQTKRRGFLSEADHAHQERTDHARLHDSPDQTVRPPPHGFRGENVGVEIGDPGHTACNDTLAQRFPRGPRG